MILKEYEDAEKALKSFYKSNPNYTKSLADIVYVYLLEGKTDKADRQFKEILNTLPPKSQIIRNLGSNFQSRGLNDMAKAIYEKGNKLLDDSDNLNMDLAYLSQSTAN